MKQYYVYKNIVSVNRFLWNLSFRLRNSQASSVSAELYILSAYFSEQWAGILWMKNPENNILNMQVIFYCLYLMAEIEWVSQFILERATQMISARALPNVVRQANTNCCSIQKTCRWRADLMFLISNLAFIPIRNNRNTWNYLCVEHSTFQMYLLLVLLCHIN